MNWKLLAGIIVSGLLLFFAARNVDIQKLWEVLKNVNYWYFLLVLFLTMLYMWIRAYRWHFLLRPVKRIPYSSLFSATMIGFMANNLFPARLGELVRAMAIGRKAQISRSVSFATIVFERVLDGFSILTFLIILLLFSPVPHDPLDGDPFLLGQCLPKRHEAANRMVLKERLAVLAQCAFRAADQVIDGERLLGGYPAGE